MATFHGPVLQCEYTVKIKKRQYAGNGVGDKGRIWCDWRGAQHVDWASLGEPHRTWKNGNFNGPLDIIFACCIALWSHIIICALYRSWCLARELEPGVCTCGTCGTKWYTCSTQSMCHFPPISCGPFMEHSLKSCTTPWGFAVMKCSVDGASHFTTILSTTARWTMVQQKGNGLVPQHVPARSYKCFCL